MPAHILMIAERLFPARGGVEQHVAGLIPQLAQRGYQLTLVAPAHTPGLPAQEFIPGATIWRIPPVIRGRYAQAWRWWWAHRFLLYQADLIHCHDVYALLHWLGPLRWLVPHKPVYLTYHGYEMRYPVPHRAWWYRWLSRFVARDSIAIGHFLTKWFPLRPRFITYGAVQRPPHPLPLPETPHALFMGRLAEDTGLDLYLRGIGTWQRATGRVLPVTVCGDGVLRPHLEQLAQQEGVKAKFVGWVTDTKPYWEQASLALTSGYLVMLEAMAYRRPVLSVYHTPVKADYLQLIPAVAHIIRIASNPDNIATQLSELLDGTKQTPQVAAAYEFARQHSWEELAALYEQLWCHEG